MDKSSEVDALLSKWDSDSSAGVSLAVVQNGELVHIRGYGMANLEHSIPVSATSVFYVASISKQFTAACIAMLELEGKVSRDDDVRNYVPELRDYGAPIRIRHLIHHTSGLSDYFVLASLPGAGPVNLPADEDFLDLLNRQTSLEFEPGTRYFYSNSGYVLLSIVVKKVTGQPLGEFAEDRIFSRLGMTSTSFNSDHTVVVKDRASGYAPRPDGSFCLNEDRIDLVGDAGVLSTVGDLYLWDQEFYEKKLGDELISKLTKPGALDKDEPVSYAYGLFIGKRRDMPAVWHGGGWAGFRAGFLRLPSERFSVILLSNHAGIDPTGVIHRIANLFIPDTSNQTIEVSSRVVLTTDELSRWAGHYEDEDKGMEFELSVDGDALLFALVPKQKFRLVPVGGQKFRTEGDGPTWELDVWESPEGLRCLRVRATPFLMDQGRIWTAVECSVADVSSLKPEDYEGRFFSEALHTTWMVSSGDGGLAITSHRETTVFRPTLVDRFQSSTIVIDFERNNLGSVVGLMLRRSGIGDVSFIKE